MSFVTDMIKRHEGLVLKPYHCTAGKLTIGYGVNLEAGITEREAEYLMINRVNNCEKYLSVHKFWPMLNEIRRAVLIDMCYQMGLSGFSGFKRMIAALEKADFEEASLEMLKSKWARSDSPTRAQELADLMYRGKELT